MDVYFHTALCPLPARSGAQMVRLLQVCAGVEVTPCGPFTVNRGLGMVVTTCYPIRWPAGCAGPGGLALS